MYHTYVHVISNRLLNHQLPRACGRHEHAIGEAGRAATGHWPKLEGLDAGTICKLETRQSRPGGCCRTAAVGGRSARSNRSRGHPRRRARSNRSRGHPRRRARSNRSRGHFNVGTTRCVAASRASSSADSSYTSSFSSSSSLASLGLVIFLRHTRRQHRVIHDSPAGTERRSDDDVWLPRRTSCG